MEKQAQIIAIERTSDGKFARGNRGGPGRGAANSRVKRDRAKAAAWITKHRVLQAARELKGQVSLETLMAKFAEEDCEGYLKFVASLTPDWPVEHQHDNHDIIGSPSPQVLIEQLQSAKLAAEATEQPHLFAPGHDPNGQRDSLGEGSIER